MAYIDAGSNRSRIACIMVVTVTDCMQIQNFPNRIGCRVKKFRVRTPLLCTSGDTRCAFYASEEAFIPKHKTKHASWKTAEH